jgi:hypothetical protein
VPRRSVARTAHEQAEGSVEAGGKFGRSQQLAASGGELERQRQAVQPPADLGDMRRGALVQDKPGIPGTDAVEEHRHAAEAIEVAELC